MLMKHMQNVTDTSVMALYIYSTDRHMSWTHISPRLHNTTFLEGTIPSDRESPFGPLTRQDSVSAQVCVHTPVSMEPCAGERGKAKQNKTVPGLVVAGSELAEGTWKQHIAMVWVRDD